MKTLVCSLLSAGLILAQGPQAAFKSFEVHPDRTVTFRLNAPQAVDVQLSANFNPGLKPMKKDEKGIWSITVGPLQPYMYHYTFNVDGVRVIDPANQYSQRGAANNGSSMFEVYAPAAEYWNPRPVPHGQVHIHYYESKAVGAMRRVQVYTPPDYYTSKKRYPVFYLLHGSGQMESEWVDTAHANLILDNLIAEGKVKPMVVVMPYGHPQASMGLGNPDAPRPQAQGNAFQSDLFDQIMPLAEKTYRVSTKPEDRAIAGLSMGGGQASSIGFNNTDKFRAVGVFSAGIGGGGGGGGGGNADPAKSFPKLIADPAATNKMMKVIWIGCGKADAAMAGAKKLDDMLKQYQIRHTFFETEGVHEWKVWQLCLREFAQLLFK